MADNNIDKDPEQERAEWRAIYAALRMYLVAYGNVDVPHDFVVPPMMPWPRKYY